MPPGVKPMRHPDLARGARRSAESSRVGSELRVKYGAFAKAAEAFCAGDSVRVRNGDASLLKREVDEFSSIDSGVEVDGGVIACYASDWDDAMAEMVGKVFRIVQACSDTGQLVVKVLPGAKGCCIRKENAWSNRFAMLDGSGDNWLMPATAFEKMQVEGRCRYDQPLKPVTLGWHEGYIHTRTCKACERAIPRDKTRYQCPADCPSGGCHNGNFDICWSCLSGYAPCNFKGVIEGDKVIRVFRVQ